MTFGLVKVWLARREQFDLLECGKEEEDEGEEEEEEEEEGQERSRIPK